ncbi:DUF1672 family protein [Staphylococcus caprae]|uniref:DUF1672 family protein n=1 Tax=Staphylococcus caprae TaxID=29380 RepID=UPI0009E1C5C9|nr:DUF1672 family protein [Staphylococcus caprae]
MDSLSKGILALNIISWSSQCTNTSTPSPLPTTNAYKSTNYEAKIDVVTTLFSTMDSYSKKKNTNNVFKLAKDIENSKGMPNNIDMDLQFTDENINTVNPLYSKKDVTNFGVFDEYK